MPSQLKSETARANGAKSRGPVTPQGRAASSRNSLCHGFTAKFLILAHESIEDFESLLSSYIDHFDPQGGVETDLVQAMAAARWRLRRIETIETTLLSNEMVRRAEDIDEEFKSMSGDDSLAWVFQALANEGHSLDLLIRYEGALNRSYDRAFKHLHTLQSARRRSQPAAQPNEPNANPEPPVTPSTTTSSNPRKAVDPAPAPAPALGDATPPLLSS